MEKRANKVHRKAHTHTHTVFNSCVWNGHFRSFTCHFVLMCGVITLFFIVAAVSYQYITHTLQL